MPNNYFLHLFKETLSSNGILFDGDMLFKNVNPKSLKVVTHNEPIDSIVVRLNKTSDNLSAENLLRIMSAYKYSPPGNTQSGLWIVNETVSKLGLDTTTFLIVDGSGMSNYNLITTNHYIVFLKSIYVNQELFERMYASLPIAGVDGTLKNRMKKSKAENNLRAKTGSHSGISSLTGFIKSEDGEMFAFSIFMQNFIGSPTAYRNAQDKIGIEIARFKRD